MKIASLAGLSLSLLLLVACEPCKHYNRLQVVAYTGPVKAAKAERKPYGSIRPYNNAKEIGRNFEVIGFMSCEASAADEAAVLKAMLYRAADMGADGVLLNPAPISAESTSANRIDVRLGWAAMIGNGDNREYRGQAIRFK